MKVAFATYDSDKDIGGVSSWLQRLLPRLLKAGIEAEVHVLGYGRQPGINCAGFEKQGIPWRWRPWKGDMRRQVRDCLSLIEESQPEVYVPSCILPAYYAAGHVRKQGVHTVGVLHSDDPFYWGIVDEFVNGSPAFRLSAVVPVSKYLQEAVEAATKKHNIILRRIGYGVPVSGCVVQPPDGVFRLVYVGRLVDEQKCISEVTQALCSVIKQNSRIEAWIVGDGRGRAKVEQIILASGIDPQRIRLLGRVEVANIYSVLQDCHAFVLLSDYEGLPVAMLEAMMVGVVPVCLDMRSGIREAIQPGFNGIIVKDRKEDFCAAIQTLQKDTSLWSTLSANARETVHQRFSDETCAAAWVELLGSFENIKRIAPIKSPLFMHLPRLNPKFGFANHRRLKLLKHCGRLRGAIGTYGHKLLSAAINR